jgi:hypothetical protein
MVQSYLNHCLAGLKVPVKASVVRTTAGSFLLTHLKFPKLKLEASTEDIVIEQLKVLIRQELQGASIAKMDCFFEEFYKQ